MPIYLSDSLFEQETIDSNIEKTPIDSPLQIHKTKILSEIYEQTLVINEHVHYAFFSYQPTFFEEALKDAQWVEENEEVNENDEVIVIEKEPKDVNALQEELKYIHIFFDKMIQCARKLDRKKNYVETKKEDLHYVPKDEEDPE